MKFSVFLRVLGLALVANTLVGCGGSVSPGATAPQILTQPQSMTVVDGQQAMFTVAAAGSTPLGYQWLRNGQQIANAQSTNYIIPAVQYGESGTTYSVVVYNTVGPVTSNAATLTVTPVAAAITSQPSSQTVVAGGSVTFYVVASGTTPLNYQWNKNGVAIPGAVNPSYVYGGAQLADNGAQITVTVSNVVNTVTSNAATLTVQSSAPVIVAQPQQQTVLAGTAATFNVVATGAPPLSFQWFENGAPISGATSSSYVTPVTSVANTGAEYDVVVTNSSGSVTSANAMLTVESAIVAPSISTQPQSLTAAVGASATFSVAAAGTQPLSYQWQVGGTNIPGATNSTYTLSPVSAGNNKSSYTVTVANAAGSVTSQAAVLTVTVPSGGIDLIAGQLGGAGNINGAGAAARFNGPAAVALDAAGNVYVADTYNSNIRETSASGAVITIAGAGKPGSQDGVGTSAQFSFPAGIATDAAGDIYVADSLNSTIRKITSAGVVTTFAGTVGVTGSTDGQGTMALFANPQGLATDSAGNVYVADSDNSTIRMITPAGVVSTLAGSAGTTGATDGTGAAALFNGPQGVATDAAGNIYVADTGNGTIRKIAPGGVVTTLAGTPGVSGWVDGTGAAAQFDSPQGVATDAAGNVYVADSFNDTIRLVTPAGVVSTLAGTGYVQGSADGTGPAAQFRNPRTLAVDAAGNLYVADFSNDTLRKITPTAAVTTLAGRAPEPGSVDGTGSAAQFDAPQAAATDAAGNLYIADTTNNTIRKITPAGVVTTLAGTAGATGSNDGTGGAAQFNSPEGLIVDGSGNVYVADTGNDTIRQITAAGVVTTVAGSALAAGSTDGTGGAARFNGPQGIVIDKSGNLYVADTGNDTIRKISSGGVVTTLAGTAGVTGATDATGAAAQFDGPRGMAIDAAGNIYIADSTNATIRMLTAAGIVTTIAGSPGAAGFADGTGTDARFDVPTGITIDSSGNLYVVDNLHAIIREITPAAVVSTVAGYPGAHGVTLGALPGTFSNPVGIAILPGTGVNLIVPDKGENAVLQVTLL